MLLKGKQAYVNFHRLMSLYTLVPFYQLCKSIGSFISLLVWISFILEDYHLSLLLLRFDGHVIKTEDESLMPWLLLIEHRLNPYTLRPSSKMTLVHVLFSSKIFDVRFTQFLVKKHRLHWFCAMFQLVDRGSNVSTSGTAFPVHLQKRVKHPAWPCIEKEAFFVDQIDGEYV
jgi:hypothetical protein